MKPNLKQKDLKGKFIQQNINSLMSRVHKTESCWLWTGLISQDGYGKVGYNYKTYRAHRLIFELLTKQNINNKYLCHSCDNPLCVNPKHLFIGTQKDNIKDASNKNRRAIGEKHPQHKLTEKEVLEIRNLKKNGKTIKELSYLFKVNQSSISAITTYRYWKHI